MRRVELRILYKVCSASFGFFSCAPLAMFEAFELCKLVEKLPLKICAIATWGELTLPRAPRETRGNRLSVRINWNARPFRLR